MMYKNSWLPEVFNDFFYNNNMPKTNATAPAINVLENETEYTVELAAPGLRKEDFDISINNDGDLVIKMEKKNEVKDEKAHYLRREHTASTSKPLSCQTMWIRTRWAQECLTVF